MSTQSTALNRLRKSIFYGSMVFISVSFLSITVCQAIPLEFADIGLRNQYYQVVMGGVPFAILLTMTGTIKMTHKPATNISVLFITLIGAFISFYIMISIMFKVAFGVWTDTDYVLHNIKHPEITVKKQTEDLGAFGTGAGRVVKITPFLWYWNRVTAIDTASLNKEEWTRSIN